MNQLFSYLQGVSCHGNIYTVNIAWRDYRATIRKICRECKYYIPRAFCNVDEMLNEERTKNNPVLWGLIIYQTPISN